MGWRFVFMEQIADNLACEKISGSRNGSRLLASGELLRDDLSELLKLFELLATWDQEIRN